MRPIHVILLFVVSATAVFGQSTPSLTYSTYLRAGFAPAAVATDSAGNVYLAGSALTVPGSSQKSAMVVKLSPDGAHYLYVRTFGGALNDSAASIAVDSSGNAYITGTAGSPDFPVSPGRQLGTPPSSATATRAFAIKLDPQGDLVFSELVGGSSVSSGLATAVTPQGNILVSGLADSTFPTTPGAYAANGTLQRPFLMELDPTGATVKFAAFGVGGSALALDTAGNIYAAGSTYLTDYPATPGSYQPVFSPVFICGGFCRISFPGTNQYLTKLDPAATHLIYSTAVGGGGQTVNAGLAVDSAGNAYLTGVTWGSYPFTVPDPGVPEIRPFLTKIDPAGKSNVYSIPIGGAGVAFDNSGHVLAGGTYSNNNYSAFGPNTLPPPPTGAVNLAAPCLLSSTTYSQAYVSQVDAITGNVQSSQLMDSANLTAAAIAISGSTVWLAGAALTSDVPTTLNALSDSALSAPAGAFLGQVSYSAANATAPQIACILDSVSGLRPSATARYQILSLFGSNLGPAQGVAAPDAPTRSLGGVGVLFDGSPAPLLYASASQINLLVPAFGNNQAATTFQVSFDGQTSPARQLATTAMNPNLFVDVGGCPGGPIATAGGQPFAVMLNQDGSTNTCNQPAHAGSTVSLFVDGLSGGVGAAGQFVPVYLGGVAVAVTIDHWSAEVVNVVAVSDYVWRIDVLIPPGVVNGYEALAYVGVTVYGGSGLLAAAPAGFGYPTVAFWVAP